jgi:hypothetical protein
MNTAICYHLSLINLLECTGGEHVKPRAFSGFNTFNLRVIWHTLIVLLYVVGVYFQFTFHAHTARNEQL